VGPREFYEEIASTQDRAIELARAGAPDGTRVVARRQHRGRGRLDHAWSSPDGGLYLSIVLRAPSERVTWLPLVLGAELARSLSRRWPLRLRVKWPNDLLVTEDSSPARKLGGVLVDRIEGPDRAPVEVAGIGINVGTDLRSLPADLGDRATSLAEFVRPPPTLDAVEAIAVRAAESAVRGLRGRRAVDAPRRLCAEWLYGIGRRATVDGVTTGTIAGLGDSGELLLDQGPHRLVIRAGDVRVEGVA
jgi:BirA family transcriptional regulator, biotin operon repressor / biotin---[acetyl-CoA-carboxylase] ligase